MYPEADVPVVQLSLDSRQPGAFHYELARLLRPLRDEGVLILGSGNIVHNLRLADFGRDSGYDWAIRFDAFVRARIEAGEHESLAALTDLGPDARLAIPTPEHYLPLLYALGAGQPGDRVRVFNAGAVLGSISMTSVVVGAARPRLAARHVPRAWMARRRADLLEGPKGKGARPCIATRAVSHSPCCCPRRSPRRASRAAWRRTARRRRPTSRPRASRAIGSR